jgi:hypothetical protein
MSERIHSASPESVPQPHNAEKTREHLEKLREKAEAEGEKHSSSENIEKAKSAVEAQAISGKEMSPAESNKDSAPSTGYVNRELKDMAFKRSLNTARRHMSAPARVMSKVIHAPVIEKASEVAGSTVARPSGLLGGGILSLIGTSILLWITKHYGYEYNYLVFFMLFVSGFAIGMIIELLFRAFVRRRKR